MELSDKNWDSTGRAEFVQRCRQHVDSGKNLTKILYNACVQVVEGHLRSNLLISGLYEVVGIDAQLPLMLTDVFLALDMETSAIDTKTKRDNFINLLTGCSNTIVPDFLLKERLDPETTGDAKIIPSKKMASTKFIKLKTKLFYKQQKFNLFREESEGYAKLITELCQHSGFNCDKVLENLRALIGCFNLDPNRVLDVVLECFECQPHLVDTYIPLLHKFLNNSSTLAQILAFKFSFYHTETPRFTTPSSLYKITALILHAKLISLDQLYDYLLPTDRCIADFYQEQLKEAREASKRSIFASAEEKMEDDGLSEFDKFLLIPNNQKLGLCEALLEIGEWSTVKPLINRLPPYYAVSHPNISKKLCSLLHYVIDPIYHTHSGLSPSIINKVKLIEFDYPRNVKQATKPKDLRDSVFPMISNLGPYLYSDTLLISKIVRIGRSLMTSSDEKEFKYDLLNLLDESILPSMSSVASNCGLADELWQFLRHFDYTARYSLYSNWKRDNDLPILIKVRTETMRSIKYTMKRLSKENVKFSGRQIGKLSHSNPSYLFEYITLQVQSYDNLIGPVVDSLKYLTSLSYDVLIYCIIDASCNLSKDGRYHDGLSISPLLLSLANFTGSFVKKYSVDLPGLLQFIANQLKAGKSLDLLILKEIIQKMTGIEASEEVTNDQLSAMTGGELLKAEGGYFNQVRNTRKSSVRLKDTLLESNLAMPLCILMAQQRNCILFNDKESPHIKLVGKLYDQCQETLVQYGSFLALNLCIDDYIGRLPPLAKLITDYHLNADGAFFLARPMITYNINLKFEELRRSERSLKDSQSYIDAWECVTKPLVDTIIPAYPSKFWEDLSPRFFVTFWTLETYDLEVPKSSYEREIDRLRGQITSLEDNKELAISKKKKEIERCKLLYDRLLEEQSVQAEHVRRVKQRLEKERNQWFHSKLAKVEMTTQFLQHCLFPRCIFTASDALYCAKFVHLLHSIKTPNFSTLICYDKIFGDISYTLSSCTEKEANHYGRFLCSLIETVSRWHKDKETFERECAKFPGFVTKFVDKDPSHVDYENYRHVCHKWHYRLTKAFILCLESGDYVQIRNALIILIKMNAFFPAIESFAKAIDKRVELIRGAEHGKRPDLHALATGYAGQLKLRRSACVPESQFHDKSDKQVMIKKESKQEPKQEPKDNPNSVPKSPVAKEKRENNNKIKTDTFSKTKEQDKNEVKEMKEIKNDVSRSKKEDKPSKSESRNHMNSDKNKTDQRTNSSNSPRHNDRSESRGRSVEPPNDSEREYKRRKVESKVHDDSERRNDKDRNDTGHEKKKGDDSTSSSPTSGRNHHEKKSTNSSSSSSSSRKRETNEESPGEPSVKKKKEDDSIKAPRKTPSNEERESSRKSADNKRSSSSRRSTNKSEDK
ncbi:THO complex subunit 2-like protein [Brevipalpus obovatus]|uniref:THO complex subunit 2-like protein n=1 Tax=Brevipalpus obovatus TaxID=246614 RepID=UPI003D9DC03B